MDIRVLGCYGGETPGHRTTCFLINTRLLVDAGAATAALPLKDQARIDAVVVSHAHLDHIRDLPFMADNIFGKRSKPLRIFGLPETIRSLRTHVFNDLLWPDFTRLPNPKEPILSFHELREGSPQEIEGITFTAVKVDHAVPCAGLIVKDAKSCLAISGDTGPTAAFWEAAAKEQNLAALFLETSFPDRLRDLAEQAGHLTPASARAELAKLGPSQVPVYLYHMKPQYLKEIIGEIDSKDPRLHILRQGDHLEI